MVIPFIIWLSICYRPIILLFSTPQYLADIWPYLLLSLTIGVFGIYQIFIYIIVLEGNTWYNLKVSLWGASFNALCLYALIEPLELTGVALANLLGNILLSYLTIRKAQNYSSVPFPIRPLLKILFASSLFGGVLLAGSQLSSIDTIPYLLFWSILASIIYIAASYPLKKDLPYL